MSSDGTNIPLKDEKVWVKVDDMWGVGRMELEDV